MEETAVDGAEATGVRSRAGGCHDILRRGFRLLRTPSLVVLALACGRGSDDPAQPGPREFETVIHTNFAEYQAAPVLEITGSSPACSLDCQVSARTAVAASPDGSFAVSDTSGFVFRYSPVGTRIGSVRLPPGFPATAIDIDSLERLVVFSLGPNELATFEWSGRLIARRAIRLPLGSEDFVVAGGRLIDFMVPPGRAADDVVTGRFLAYDAERSDFAEIASRPFRPRTVFGNAFSERPPMFGARSVWTVDRRLSIYYSDGEECRVEVFLPSGAPPRLITCPVKSEPVARSDLQKLEQKLRSKIDAAPPSFRPSMERDLVDRIRNASASRPLIQSLRVSDGGDLWMEHGSSPESPLRKWTVFRADGRVRARLELPARMSLIAPYETRLLAQDLSGGVSRLVWVNLRPRSSGATARAMGNQMNEIP